MRSVCKANESLLERIGQINYVARVLTLAMSSLACRFGCRVVAVALRGPRTGREGKRWTSPKGGNRGNVLTSVGSADALWGFERSRG